MDVAASEFYGSDKTFDLNFKEEKISGDKLKDLYKSFVSEYPVVSIEDPFDQDDWEHYSKMTGEIGAQVQIVGDDLLVTNPKDSEHGKNEEKYFISSNDFVASPEGTASPSADNSFHKPFTFEDSVTGSPHSPSRNSMESSRDLFFDNFSGYNFLSRQDSVSSRQASVSHFDSINSTKGVDHSRDYSFDGTDPFGSTGPFKAYKVVHYEKYEAHERT